MTIGKQIGLNLYYFLTNFVFKRGAKVILLGFSQFSQ